MNHSLVRHGMCQCMWAEISFSEREKKTERLHLLKCAGPTEITVVCNLMGESWETAALGYFTLSIFFSFLKVQKESGFVSSDIYFLNKKRLELQAQV